MRRACLLAIFVAVGCGDAASPESAEEEKAAPPRVQPLALSAFEQGAVATVQQARNEQAAEDLEDKAKSAMQTYLLDPFSARFRNLRSGRGGAVCGQVNAKNRMGAYVGFKDFVIGRDGRQVWMSSYNDGVRTELYGGFAEAHVNACASRREADRHRRATEPYYGHDGYYGTETNTDAPLALPDIRPRSASAAEEGYQLNRQ